MGQRYQKNATTEQHSEHVDSANARKVMSGIEVPGTVITSNISSAGVLVGKGNICRIRVTGSTYVAFSDDPAIGAVSSSTATGIELSAAGTYKIVATGAYIRASANAARLEVIEG